MPISSFIHGNFLLHSKAAERLYHEYAEREPILDYHCHLSSQDIAENRQFSDLYEIWLAGDHYKWRAMRANGISERCCTGEASPREKFQAWASTVPYTLRNPLYQWTHLELKRYFGISVLLNEETAEHLWERANRELPSLSTQAILTKFGVRALCTTDDPADDLIWHKQVAQSSFGTKVFPTFRPDRAHNISDPEGFNRWVDRLASAAQTKINDFDGFLEALQRRHRAFHDAGCRLSDHGLKHCFQNFCSPERAKQIFSRVRAGSPTDHEERAQFSSFLMLFFAKLDAERGWTKQLHLGALRNANTRRMRELGPDTGFDSIGDYQQAMALRNYLNALEIEGTLPKMIIYNLNPADNYVIASMIGNFQNGSVAGKIQFGSGWWFLDQKEGIEWQLNALSNIGLLSRFIGMLTDSRSFMSFPRHEYFRRVLCNLLGTEMERGELPNDFALVGEMVRNICFENARRYLNLPGVSR